MSTTKKDQEKALSLLNFFIFHDNNRLFEVNKTGKIMHQQRNKFGMIGFRLAKTIFWQQQTVKRMLKMWFPFT